MKEYQVKSLKSFRLPEAVYRQALWAVKDLPRLKEKKKELEDMLGCIPAAYTGIPRGRSGCYSDQTARIAGEMAETALRLRKIEESLNVVPLQYREEILGKLAYDIPYSDRFHLNTWKRWQQIYLYQVAVDLHLY